MEQQSDVVDVRGMACPQPVILTRQALERSQQDRITVVADNETARDNITKMAQLPLLRGGSGPAGRRLLHRLSPSLRILALPWSPRRICCFWWPRTAWAAAAKSWGGC